MTVTFSGPSIRSLIPSLTGAILVGAVYDSWINTQSASIQVTDVLMIRAVADFFFYQMLKGRSSRENAKIYAFTNLLTNGIVLGALFKSQQIGLIGIAFFLTIMAIEGVCKTLNFSKFSPSAI